MPDEIDVSLTQQEADLERCIEAARGTLPPLTTGICDQCGIWSESLRNCICTPCRSDNERRRDMYRL